MKHNKKFIYPTCVRSNVDGQRIYDIDGGKFKLPSVTTILSPDILLQKSGAFARLHQTIENCGVSEEYSVVARSSN